MTEAVESNTQIVANHVVAQTIQLYRAGGLSDHMIAQTMLAGALTLIRDFDNPQVWSDYFLEASDLLRAQPAGES